VLRSGVSLRCNVDLEQDEESLGSGLSWESDRGRDGVQLYGCLEVERPLWHICWIVDLSDVWRGFIFLSIYYLSIEVQMSLIRRSMWNTVVPLLVFSRDLGFLPPLLVLP